MAIDKKRSVPAPLLPTRKTTLFYYDPGIFAPSLQHMVGCTYQQEMSLKKHVRAALRVIFAYSMRAQEYLQLETTDIISADRVLVSGKKRSASYIIHLPGIEDQLKRLNINPVNRSLSGCTYNQLYRGCVNAKIGEKFSGHQNTVRTHISRHLLVNDLNKLCGERAIGDCLHHRSNDSVTYYGEKRRQKYGKA